MRNSLIIQQIENLIAEAVSKDCWLWHKGQEILLSPMSLKNNIANNKYLVPEGWAFVPVDSVIARYTHEASQANKMLATMMQEIEDSNKFFKPETENETTLKVVQ